MNSGRRAKHVSRACNNCRKKKTKCDAAQPRCGACASNDLVCTFVEFNDKRTVAGRLKADHQLFEHLKAEKAQLEAYIAILRAALEAANVPVPAPPLMAGAAQATFPNTVPQPTPVQAASALIDAHLLNNAAPSAGFSDITNLQLPFDLLASYPGPEARYDLGVDVSPTGTTSVSTSSLAGCIAFGYHPGPDSWNLMEFTEAASSDLCSAENEPCTDKLDFE